MVDKIKGIIRGVGKRKLAVILLLAVLGVALIVCSAGTGAKVESGDASSLSEYKRALEEELETMCSSVAGVGKCRVFVSFSEGERTEYSGSQIKSSTPPVVLGVTVLCEGGDSPRIQSEISDMMAALFDIGRNRICVLELS